MKAIFFVLSVIASQSLFAQAEVMEKTYPFTNQYLDIDLDLGTDLVVKAWSKNEIYVKVTYEVNGGDDNEALRIDIDDYNDRLSLDIDLEKHKLSESDDCCCSGKKPDR